MYESILERDRDLGPLFRGRDPALFHAGGTDRLLRVHERHAAIAAAGNHAGLPPVGPFLLRRLADARTMMSACDDLLRRGGKAPGPNGRRLDEMDRAEQWSLCRQLARAVRDGTYRPGRGRRVQIPKEGKPGQFRELTVQDAEDRVVGRAAVRILQPVLEPGFSPFSFGFRPGRGTQAALATALALAQARQRWVWVSDDVAKAFDKIPFNRFLDTCRTHFPPDVVEFIGLMAYAGRRRGLPQGSPASPLFANVYFDHHLDRPRHAARPDLPLFRYADDLLVACRTVEEAAGAYGWLSDRMTAAGTPLKGSADAAVYDLSAGQSVDWLGYRVCLAGGVPAVRVAERAWRRLGWHLEKAHLLPASPVRATQIVRGWLAYLGPCFAWEDRRAVLARVRQTAGALAFDEIPGDRDLLRGWRAAHARWHRVRSRELRSLPHRLQRVCDGTGEGVETPGDGRSDA